MCVGFVVTILFARGQLALGTILALLVGLLDGLDGKLARTKVETTRIGQWEHSLDYFIELSWWSALAWHYQAFLPLALLVGSDLLDRLVKRAVKQKLQRNLDDVSGFDRFVRFLGGRRNIYVWIFALA